MNYLTNNVLGWYGHTNVNRPTALPLKEKANNASERRKNETSSSFLQIENKFV